MSASVRPSSLPARVLDHLQRGPDYTTNIAEALGATSGAVSQAITTLRQRHLVAVDRKERGAARARIYYRAEPAAVQTAQQTAAVQSARELPPATAEVELLTRLDEELRLLRFEHQFAGGGLEELEVLMAQNGL